MRLLCGKLGLDAGEPLIDGGEAGDDLVQALLEDMEDPAEPEDGDGEPDETDYLEHS
jgi:hypothetical protein